MFQPLNIFVNKSAKILIAENYKNWYANQVAQQLKNGVSAPDVKIDVETVTRKVDNRDV